MRREGAAASLPQIALSRMTPSTLHASSPSPTFSPPHRPISMADAPWHQKHSAPPSLPPPSRTPSHSYPRTPLANHPSTSPPQALGRNYFRQHTSPTSERPS